MAREEFIKIRATPEERKDAEMVAAARGKSLSQILREHLVNLKAEDANLAGKKEVEK